MQGRPPLAATQNEPEAEIANAILFRTAVCNCRVLHHQDAIKIMSQNLFKSPDTHLCQRLYTRTTRKFVADERTASASGSSA
ncbi:hypothetical protein BH24CHL4_BH24CHL4_19420 [soil metagenome]